MLSANFTTASHLDDATVGNDLPPLRGLTADPKEPAKGGLPAGAEYALTFCGGLLSGLLFGCIFLYIRILLQRRKRRKAEIKGKLLAKEWVDVRPRDDAEYYSNIYEQESQKVMREALEDAEAHALAQQELECLVDKVVAQDGRTREESREVINLIAGAFTSGVVYHEHNPLPSETTPEPKKKATPKRNPKHYHVSSPTHLHPNHNTHRKISKYTVSGSQGSSSKPQNHQKPPHVEVIAMVDDKSELLDSDIIFESSLIQ